MEDLFKKLLYAGAGLAVTAKESLEKSIDELIEKGKLSDEEGKKFVENFFEKTAAKREEFEEKMTKVTEQIAAKLNYVKKTELEAMIKRLEELEAKMKEYAKQ